MMYDLKTMKENYEIIKEFCGKYRTELTIAAGILGESMGMINCDEYIKFSNSLSIDEFVGNYLVGLINGTVDEYYRPILNDEKTFEEMLDDTLDEELLNLYREKLNN